MYEDKVEAFDRRPLVVPYVLRILAKILWECVPGLLRPALDFPIAVESVGDDCKWSPCELIPRSFNYISNRCADRELENVFSYCLDC